MKRTKFQLLMLLMSDREIAILKANILIEKQQEFLMMEQLFETVQAYQFLLTLLPVFT